MKYNIGDLFCSRTWDKTYKITKIEVNSFSIPVFILEGIDNNEFYTLSEMTIMDNFIKYGSKQTVIFDKCTCSSYDIFHFGCKCGGK